MDVGKIDHHRRGLDPSGGATRHRSARVEMDRARSRRKAWPVGAVLLAAVLATAAPAVASCRLTVLGDSLAAGYGVPTEDAFPVRLEAALRARGADCAVLNAGVSGDTSAGGAARLDWVLADQPTHLLVELGGNDALRALPVDQLRANLDQIITTAKARGVQVILAGMLAPPNLGRAYGDAFRQVYADLAAKHQVPLYPFFLDGAVLQDGLMQPDGIHPNSRGVKVIVARMAPFIANQVQDKG
jgi:acyl-CoA thioesterase-1